MIYFVPNGFTKAGKRPDHGSSPAQSCTLHLLLFVQVLERKPPKKDQRKKTREEEEEEKPVNTQCDPIVAV